MSVPVPKTDEDRQALAEAMSRLRADNGFAESFSFDALLTNWIGLVRSLEAHGYPSSFFDYLHDLGLRDDAEEVKRTLPESFAAELDRFLMPWDERFRFATEAIPEPLVEPDDQRFFWWWRIPLRAGSDFREQLMSHSRGLERD